MIYVTYLQVINYVGIFQLQIHMYLSMMDPYVMWKKKKRKI